MLAGSLHYHMEPTKYKAVHLKAFTGHLLEMAQEVEVFATQACQPQFES